MLTKEEIREITAVVADGTGVTLTPEQVVDLVVRDGQATLIGLMRDYGADDTEVRADLCALLTEELIGQDIPTNGEARARGGKWIRDYWRSLHAAARQAGYAVNESVGVKRSDERGPGGARFFAATESVRRDGFDPVAWVVSEVRKFADSFSATYIQSGSTSRGEQWELVIRPAQADKAPSLEISGLTDAEEASLLSSMSLPPPKEDTASKQPNFDNQGARQSVANFSVIGASGSGSSKVGPQSPGFLITTIDSSHSQHAGLPRLLGRLLAFFSRPKRRGGR